MRAAALRVERDEAGARAGREPERVKVLRLGRPEQSIEQLAQHELGAVRHRRRTLARAHPLLLQGRAPPAALRHRGRRNLERFGERHVAAAAAASGGVSTHLRSPAADSKCGQHLCRARHLAQQQRGKVDKRAQPARRAPRRWRWPDGFLQAEPLPRVRRGLLRQRRQHDHHHRPRRPSLRCERAGRHRGGLEGPCAGGGG
mmetsp:Transcript_51102/g.169290  ORF Transcript_51102/g.169290 Transcript_51102/m.169290 type:complete len:201 (-) Transcript_51102:241-843(-)